MSGGLCFKPRPYVPINPVTTPSSSTSRQKRSSGDAPDVTPKSAKFSETDEEPSETKAELWKRVTRVEGPPEVQTTNDTAAGVATRVHNAQGVAVPILLLDSADNIFAPKSNADFLGTAAQQSSFTAAHHPAVGSTGLFSIDALHSPQPYIPFPWEGTNIGLFNVNDFGSTPGLLRDEPNLLTDEKPPAVLPVGASSPPSRSVADASPLDMCATVSRSEKNPGDNVPGRSRYLQLQTLSVDEFVPFWRHLATVMSKIRKTPDQIDAIFQLIAESKINLEPVDFVLDAWVADGVQPGVCLYVESCTEVPVPSFALLKDDLITDEFGHEYRSFQSTTPLQRLYYVFCIDKYIAANKSNPKITKTLCFSWCLQFLLSSTLIKSKALQSEAQRILASDIFSRIQRHNFVGGLFRGELMRAEPGPGGAPLFAVQFLEKVVLDGLVDWVAFFEAAENLEEQRANLLSKLTRPAASSLLAVVSEDFVRREFKDKVFDHITGVSNSAVTIKYHGRPKPVVRSVDEFRANASVKMQKALKAFESSMPK